MSAYAWTCIGIAVWIVLSATVTLPICWMIHRRDEQVPVQVVAEESTDDYPTVEIPVTAPLPDVPAAPAPSQHFTDGSWGRAVSQDDVDMEFDSFVAYIRSETGGWLS